MCQKKIWCLSLKREITLKLLRTNVRLIWMIKIRLWTCIDYYNLSLTFFFNLILKRLKFKIKWLGIDFDKKIDLITCEKINNYNIFMSFSHNVQFKKIIKIIIVIYF
jgi:hypothetical protein